MNKELSHAHRFISSPDPANDKSLLLLHGTAGNENSLLPIAEVILPGSTVLSPRGQVLENGMPRFFRRFSEGIFDLEDMKQRTDELAAFIRESGYAYDIGSNRLFAAGYSNGANIASSLILTYPGLITNAALYHPMIPFSPENNPNLSGTHILITAGTNDPIVSVEETRRLYELYKDYGARVEVFWHDMGHALTKEELYRTKTFFSES